VTTTEAAKAYDAGRCDVYTGDVSELYAQRLALSKPDDHVILPDIISKEPLGPAVRQGDEQWANIVKWTAFALVNAEELAVSSKSIDQAVTSDKPEIKRLVRVRPDRRIDRGRDHHRGHIGRHEPHRDVQ
jgi:general L-amino acid transport system substrate-binding protein